MLQYGMHIQLQLPYPPSVNHYWGQSGNHRFIGKKGKEFRARVMDAVNEAGIEALEGRLAVHIALFPPDRRKRDVDNVLKSLLDACEHAGCYENDNQIDELHIIRQEIIPGGACTIIILQIN
jgi:crossover junction endodeoxyribonuclease RusA